MPWDSVVGIEQNFFYISCYTVNMLFMVISFFFSRLSFLSMSFGFSAKIAVLIHNFLQVETKFNFSHCF